MTSGEMRAAVADLGDLSEWVRAEAADRLRKVGKPAFFVLITALDSPSPLQRREAAQLMAGIADDLASRPIPELEQVGPRLPTDLKGLVAALDTPDKSWRQGVELELNKRRDEAFAVLIETLKLKATTRPDRIIRLLGEWEELRAVGPLLDAWDSLGSTTYLVIVDALKSLAKKAAQHPLELTDADLLRFLIFARQELGFDAEHVGEALCRRASARPTPALRLFLPHLKGKWLSPAPASYERARVAILAATEDMASLPVPALETSESANLPRAAEPISESAGLPRAAERVE